MYTCSGKYQGFNGTIVVDNGMISFSKSTHRPAECSIGGVAIPIAQDKSSKRSNFEYNGKSYSLKEDEKVPNEIAIPVGAIFEIGVEGIDYEGRDVAVGIALGAVFVPAGLAYLGAKVTRGKLVLLVDPDVIPGNPRHEFETKELQTLCDAVKSEIYVVRKDNDLREEDKVFIKETVREVVKIACRYCGTLNEFSKMNCDKCGAPIK